MHDSKVVQRVSSRGEDKKTFDMKYEYNAEVAVTADKSRPGQSQGKASVSMLSTSTDKTAAKELNSCDRGKTWKEMKGDFSSETKTTGTGKPDANVHVGISADGTYSVSVGVPPIRGQVSGETKSSFSGQCTPKKGETHTSAPTETGIDGNSLTSDGTHRVDPKDPNKLSGSYTRVWQNVVETITWNLERCGAPLRLTDLKFEDMKFPNWNDWQEISEQRGTVDGNLVKMRAKILNESDEARYAEVVFKETFKGDKWDGARPDAPINDHIVSVRLDPGEVRDVEAIWDTSGYSWYDDGRPRMVQRIKAELKENDKLVDDMTKNVKVAPKPVMLVHGLKSNWKMWESWQNILTTSHSYDWKAFPVGEKPEKGQLHTGDFATSGERPPVTVMQNAAALKSYIEYAQTDRNAWHVDVVAHSTGGQIARNYINDLMEPMPDGKPQIAHLLMLGTPNLGSQCADLLYLATGEHAMYQATTKYAEGFNNVNRNRKGVKFSALAGDAMPTICKGLSWGDGFVTVESALWNVTDTAKTKSNHLDLNGTSDFSSFVKPRLAIGPKGNHMPDMPTIPVTNPK